MVLRRGSNFNLLLYGDVYINVNMKNRTMRLKVAGHQQKCKATPNLKSQHTLYSKKEDLQYLKSNSKKNMFKPLSVFQKQEGIDNQIRVLYAFVNVHNINVKPSIFGVIDRLNTIEHQ